MKIFIMIKAQILFFAFILTACQTGKLDVVCNIPEHLTEVSAIETIDNNDLFWVIEDKGNANNLYAIDVNGTLSRDIDIDNADNTDWEELTSDTEGNIYIGDFGNNSGKRDDFFIYKVAHSNLNDDDVNAEKIEFSLPKGIKKKDFEAFFLFNDHFYLFSKETKKCVLLKVKNEIGKQTAKLVTEFNLEGKDNKITSADISNDGKTVVLLNHDKLWKITGFSSDNFFKGTIEAQYFDHNSQKEGICFKDQNTVYISEERNGDLGSNIYSFKLH